MMDRRRFLALGGASAAAFLAACDARGPKAALRVLRWAEHRNESVERFLFRHTSMDHAASARDVGRGMPSYYISNAPPVWDEAARGRWTLEVSGAVTRPLRLTLDELARLPQV
ncbi:MAG: hypothetical protein JO306_03775, partial [Gemmatimonadetes bacterium]|nr:hypothetical protein [Gemmatimonadota bacterium]